VLFKPATTAQKFTALAILAAAFFVALWIRTSPTPPEPAPPQKELKITRSVEAGTNHVTYTDDRDPDLTEIYFDYDGDALIDSLEGVRRTYRTKFLVDNSAMGAEEWNERYLMEKYYDDRRWVGRGTHSGEILQRMYDNVRKAYEAQEKNKAPDKKSDASSFYLIYSH
jgi:hypothetical protein